MLLFLQKNILNLIYFIPIVINIAILTLLERKVLAALQRRRGPNLAGFFGILQPIMDAVKLLNKELIIPNSANSVLFLFSSIFIFTLSLTIWSIFPQMEINSINNFSLININLSLFFIYLISSLSIYGFVFSGWASNSKYALIGSLRSVSQMISYEVIIGTSFLIIILYTGKINILDIINIQKQNGSLFFPLLPVFLIFYISILAETARIPFDLPESESELVAGYNVEYSGITFAFFFLAEYLNLVFMNALLIIIFFNSWFLPIIFQIKFVPLYFVFFVKLFIFLILNIFLRGTLPRYRYDQLMSLGWEILLPIEFLILLFYCCILIKYLL